MTDTNSDSLIVAIKTTQGISTANPGGAGSSAAGGKSSNKTPLSKRAREPGSSGKKDPKRRKVHHESPKSILIWVTKNNDNCDNLTANDYRELSAHLVDLLYDGTTLNGFEPKFVWENFVGKEASERRFLIACDDDETVEWLKRTVQDFNSSYNAWRNTEGPRERNFITFIPFPSGGRSAKECLRLMRRTNNLKGTYIIKSSDSSEKRGGQLVRFSCNNEFAESLAQLKRPFWPFCALRQVHVEEEGNRSGKNNNANDANENKTVNKNNSVKETNASSAQCVCGCPVCKCAQKPSTSKNLEQMAESESNETSPEVGADDGEELRDERSPTSANEDIDDMITSPAALPLDEGILNWADEVEKEENET